MQRPSSCGGVELRHPSFCGPGQVESARTDEESPAHVDVSTAPSHIVGADKEPLIPAPPQASWAARKRFRSGALGARHWLSRYGYEHRRSEGDLDMRVDRSVELVWAVPAACKLAISSTYVAAPLHASSSGEYACAVCGISFASADEREGHLRAQPPETTVGENNPTHPDHSAHVRVRESGDGLRRGCTPTLTAWPPCVPPLLLTPPLPSRSDALLGLPSLSRPL